MRKYERILAWLFVLLMVMIFAVGISHGQTDDFIAAGSVSPYVTLGRGLTWGGVGFGTVGQNFIFHPLDPNQGFCLFVFNNNTTSAHSFTVTVAQTGDPTVQSYANNTSHWTTVPTQTGFPVSDPANSLIGINYRTIASATVAISFTGNGTLGGSPDTADLFTVQTNQSSCGSLNITNVQGPFVNGANVPANQLFPVLTGGIAQGSTNVKATLIGVQGGTLLEGIVGTGFQSNFIVSPNSFFDTPQDSGSNRNTMMPVAVYCTFGIKGLLPGCLKTNILEEMTDQMNITTGNQTAFSINGTVTNPATGGLVLGDYLTTTASVNPAYKTLTLSCTLPCEFQVFHITSAGLTCTAVTPVALQLTGNGSPPIYNAQHAPIQGSCGTIPTVTGPPMWDVFLPSSSAFTIDLSGVVNTHTGVAIAGIGVFNVTTFVGKAIATMTLVEQ